MQTRISIAVESGTAVLRGTVATRAAAQEAETIARKFSESGKVVNLLTISEAQDGQDVVYEAGC
jgi:osmotically-inducible protein OsmY